ncbi:hypothetical protein IC006_0944 [Sulfuracidifex tepidarius]|uniref:Uncharacterized protein n=1 Tax=Sulfuracidifex tepidarius TaxID=1294262 RepID=A0A510DTV3_9CREN|nr:hypothetical protein IC006_0944 [Sulfuracidifex tepidarius]BBG26403.1 hypothetical protein IC007_0911 [Sulfuracidifex tepidarius]
MYRRFYIYIKKISSFLFLFSCSLLYSNSYEVVMDTDSLPALKGEAFNLL